MAKQTITVSANPRNDLGTRRSRRLRETGLVPAVIYGHKEEVLPISINRKELLGHLRRGAHVFDLSLGARSERVLVKDVQFDHLGIELLHVDFTRVSLDERVEVTVPVVLKGEPKGTKDGGVLQQIISELEVECLVTDIPDEIRVSVAELALNDVLHIKDLALPEGVRAMQDGELIVAQVREVKEEVEAPAEAGPAEPEVIGRKPAEEEAAEEEKK